MPICTSAFARAARPWKSAIRMAIVCRPQQFQRSCGQAQFCVSFGLRVLFFVSGTIVSIVSCLLTGVYARASGFMLSLHLCQVHLFLYFPVSKLTGVGARASGHSCPNLPTLHPWAFWLWFSLLGCLLQCTPSCAPLQVFWWHSFVARCPSLCSR